MRAVFHDRPNRHPLDVEQLRESGDAAVVVFSILAANTNRVNGLQRILQRTTELRGQLEAAVVDD